MLSWLRRNTVARNKPEPSWRSLAQEYRRHILESLTGFPEAAKIDLLHTPTRPEVYLLLPAGERPDAYADTFETRLRLLCVPVQRTDQICPGTENKLIVDITDRLGRKPNRFPGTLEIPQAMVWLGLDFFVHIRSDTIRKTAVQFDQLVTTVGLFNDAESKRTAEAIILDQLSGLPLELFSVSMPYDTQYFGTGLVTFSAEETVIDAGAGDGDSLKKYLSVQPAFTAWHAFEPDPHLAPLCIKTAEAIDSKKVRVVAQTLSDRSGTIRMSMLYQPALTVMHEPSRAARWT